MNMISNIGPGPDSAMDRLQLIFEMAEADPIGQFAIDVRTIEGLVYQWMGKHHHQVHDLFSDVDNTLLEDLTAMGVDFASYLDQTITIAFCLMAELERTASIICVARAIRDDTIDAMVEESSVFQVMDTITGETVMIDKEEGRQYLMQSVSESVESRLHSYPMAVDHALSAIQMVRVALAMQAATGMPDYELVSPEQEDAIRKIFASGVPISVEEAIRNRPGGAKEIKDIFEKRKKKRAQENVNDTATGEQTEMEGK